MKFTPVEVWTACKIAGFSADPKDGDGTYSPASIMTAIAIGESGLNSDAHALTTKENSWGVFQINLYAHPTVTESCARDLVCSANAAHKIYTNAGGFTPWTIYKDGSYRQNLPLPGATGDLPGASPVADPSTGGDNGTNPTPGIPGTEDPLSAFGLTLPTPEEWKQAALIIMVGAFGFAAVLIGLQNFGANVGKEVIVPIVTKGKVGDA